MKRPWGVSALAVILLAGCSSLGSSSVPSSSSASSPSSASKTLAAAPVIGVYEPGVPESWSELAEFSQATGVSPKVVVYYSAWDEVFKTGFADAALKHGSTVFVKMQPNGVALASIAAGSSDVYLRAYARAVRAFGHRVIISFAHEMNGDWYPWGTNDTTPADFVAAWRHVVQVFRDAGATNVTWVWTVNSIDGAEGNLVRWWPGSSWVSWVGVDGYFNRPNLSYASEFGSTISQIRSFSSAPVVIAETAVAMTPDRDQQITGLFDGARADHVADLIWFDVDSANGAGHEDWRLEGDSAALSTFTAAVSG
jgi:mannan endo-1,4-beta-mannosidase